MCKGLCDKDPKGNRWMYSKGNGYCKVCNRQMSKIKVNETNNNNRCYCCGMKIRLKPEHSTYHEFYDAARIE